MIKVDIQEAKTHLASYLDQVEAGEVVVVCRHDQPVAELRAIEPESVSKTRVPGLLKGLMHWEPDAFAPMSDQELSEFEDGAVFPDAGPA